MFIWHLFIPLKLNLTDQKLVDDEMFFFVALYNGHLSETMVRRLVVIHMNTH